MGTCASLRLSINANVTFPHFVTDSGLNEFEDIPGLNHIC